MNLGDPVVTGFCASRCILRTLGAVVSERGLEPPRPVRALGPQPRSSLDLSLFWVQLDARPDVARTPGAMLGGGPKVAGVPHEVPVPSPSRVFALQIRAIRNRGIALGIFRQRGLEKRSHWAECRLRPRPHEDPAHREQLSIPSRSPRFRHPYRSPEFIDTPNRGSPPSDRPCSL